MEAGDVIVKVNGTDVHRFTTKEGESWTFNLRRGSSCNLRFICTSLVDRVDISRIYALINLIFCLLVAVLKCLRLSKDSVTLDLKRGNAEGIGVLIHNI